MTKITEKKSQYFLGTEAETQDQGLPLKAAEVFLGFMSSKPNHDMCVIKVWYSHDVLFQRIHLDSPLLLVYNIFEVKDVYPQITRFKSNGSGSFPRGRTRSKAN